MGLVDEYIAVNIDQYTPMEISEYLGISVVIVRLKVREQKISRFPKYAKSPIGMYKQEVEALEQFIVDRQTGVLVDIAKTRLVALGKLKWRMESMWELPKLNEPTREDGSATFTQILPKKRL